MKTAIVYDRVNKWGGAERVLLKLHELFPDAELFTSVYSPQSAPWAKVFPKINTTFLQKLSFMRTRHEFLGTFTPIAFESFDFNAYELVISVTSEACKGIITRPGTVHVCYCLTPTRYLWSGYDEYLNNPPSGFKKIPFFTPAARIIMNYLRNWDKVAASRPDHMVAISTEVKDRIKKYYSRNSEIIFPPVNVRDFSVVKNKRTSKDYYLFVSRLIPYKKADLAIRMFNETGERLIVVGKGSEEANLKRIAQRNIEFINYASDKELAELYANAKALIFPGLEDFGIVMVESLASGTPVIAYKGGGALDIIKDGVTGVFFEKQEIPAMIQSLERFKKVKFDRNKLIKYAEKFDQERFKRELKLYLDKLLN